MKGSRRACRRARAARSSRASAWSPAGSVLQVTPAALGPRLGRDTQAVIRAVREGDWRRDGDTVVAGGIPLQDGEYSLRLVATDEAATVCLADGDGVVVLDLDVTDELEAEGLARDLVRAVQQARRDAGLAVSDRITLTDEQRRATGHERRPPIARSRGVGGDVSGNEVSATRCLGTSDATRCLAPRPR